MGVRKFLSTAKGKVIAGASAAAVVAAVVLVILLLPKGYRSITVKDVEGTVNVKGEINNGQAYAGERLYGGDDVTVMEAASLVMLMDNDKYMYADANTHFVLESDCTKDHSRIRIILDKGSELNEIKSKLRPEDTYKISTPNSTMSVRGTKFRVTVYDSDGIVYTLVEVREGTVLTQLQTSDGTFNGVEKEFNAGESALIRGNSEFSEFVPDEDGEEKRQLDYSSLPEDAVERLIALLEKNEKGGAVTTEEKTTEKTTEKKTTEKTTSEKKTTEKMTESKTTEKSTEKTATERNTQRATESVTEKATETATEAVTEKQTEENTDKKTEEAKKPTEEEKTTNHTHSFGAWKVTKAATCTESGTRERTCSCGQSEKGTIAATGHSFGEWAVVNEAGCTANGLKERKCSTCGATESESIPAQHRWGSWSSTSTCDMPGERWRICEVCGEGEFEPDEALGHIWVESTVPGDAGKYVCERCGEVKYE